MNRKVIIPTIVLTGVLAAGTIGITVTHAQSSSSTIATNSIVQKLADRFGLQQKDVLAVFDEVQSERMANRHAAWATRLEKLVQDGTITEAQKQLILDKEAQVEEQMQSLKTLSASERATKMKAIFTEVSKWASDNNIDLKKIKGLGMGFPLRNGFKSHKVTGN